MTKRHPNPYRPGFNQAPIVFAGRKKVLDGANEALQVAAYDARTPRPLFLVGPRGVGKTVTLGEIASHAAQELSWPTVHIEATSSGFLRELSVRLQHAQQLLQGTVPDHKPPGTRKMRVAGGKVEAKAFGIGGGLELDFDPAGGNTDIDVATALRHVMQTATIQGGGLLLTLDELQNAPIGELNNLGSTLQEAVPSDWPLVVAAAALPSLRSSRGPNRLPTYLERAEWHELHSLEPDAAREALTEPARQAERPFTDGAADALLELVGGYPYAIQVGGHFTWRTSYAATEITLQHAQEARPQIEADLEQLFISRWEDASDREQEYLSALGAITHKHGEAPSGGDVARALGETAQAVSYLRARLIKKGTIYADSSHRLHFITPGMAEWIHHQSEH